MGPGQRVGKGQAMTKVYRMNHPGYTDWYELHVSNTRKVMQNHIAKQFKEWGISKHLPDGMDNTAGMVHPIIDTTGQFCTMFLCEEYLGVGTVTHECLHAAMAHERWIAHFAMNYGDGMTELEDEERLAYRLTDIVNQVYDVLFANGHAQRFEKSKNK